MKDLTTKQIDFLEELKELLLKYDATIGWVCDETSDTFGIIDEKMYINIWGQKDDITFNFHNSIDACAVADKL